VQRFIGFVYQEVRMLGEKKPEAIEVRVAAHASIRARCSKCRRPSPGYDRLPERRWQFVPLWGIPVWFLYAPRWVHCAEHGVVVGAYSVERREASADDSDDGLSGTLGTASELAGNGSGISNELGIGVPLGGVVCGMGSGTPPSERRRGHRLAEIRY